MDLALRELERMGVAGDPEARARYLLARTRVEGFEGFTEDGDYAALHELDGMGIREAFEAALASFLVKAQAKVTENERRVYTRDSTFEQFKTKLTLEPGRRYLRVVKGGGGSRSVYCFIDTKGGKVQGSRTERGSILKADGWKTPARHARGSIFDASNGADGVFWHGANYLR